MEESEFFFAMAPLRADQAQYRAYKEIQDEIVLLVGQVKCFHLSETESMKEHFISFSEFPYFFKQKSTAMHYLTLFQEL